MSDPKRHEQDFSLVERCLAGEEEAIRELQRKYEPFLHQHLAERNVSPGDRQELISTLWTDCISGARGKRPRFWRYDGSYSLKAWLRTVLLNVVIDARRFSRRFVSEESRARETGEYRAGLFHQADRPDSAFLSLIGRAIREGINQCAAEQIVMIELIYLNGLTGRELARIWGCSEGTVSRSLSRCMEQIRKETLRFLRGIDPLLELRWEDFLEVCQTADWLTRPS